MIDSSTDGDGERPATRNEPLASGESWPPRPQTFPDLLTPTEAAQYLNLDRTGRHTPRSAIRTLDFFRSRGWLRATKYARSVWYRKIELERFLETKTED